MHTTASLKELLGEEVPSTDAIYDDLRFARTDPSCTRMLAAFADDRQVGLGRLINLGAHGGENHFELGGMWVAPSHRRTGLANRIIQELLSWTPPEAALWCTPFEDLMPLYAPHGFAQVLTTQAPPKLLERLDGCASSQDRSVLVTRWTPNS